MRETTWVEQYYLEVDKEQTKEILDEGIEEEGMTPENELRTKLWEVRYSRQAKETAEVDHYIRGWMSMYYLKHSSKGFFSKKNYNKEKDQILKDWGVDIAREYGEAGEKVLYQELCNMTRLYLKLCKDDKSYSSILLGIGRMKDSSLVNKIAKDVYTLAYEIPQITNTVDVFRIFTKAATDTFYAVFPKERGVLEALIEGTAR